MLFKKPAFHLKINKEENKSKESKTKAKPAENLPVAETNQAEELSPNTGDIPLGDEDPAGKFLVEMNKESPQTTVDETLLGTIKIEEEVAPLTEQPVAAKKQNSLLGNLDDLFDVEEEEVITTSDLLVNSLVDVTCEEIIDELKSLSLVIADMKQQQSQYWGQKYGL